MKFTKDWVSKNIRWWTTYLSKFKDKPIKILEIGCFEGLATLWFIKNILTHKDSKITCVDLFDFGEDVHLRGYDFSNVKSIFIENTNIFADKVRLIQGDSKVVVRRLVDKFDIIYVDGSHTAYDTLRDAILSWDLLKVGGIMMFDDYEWGKGANEIYTPKLGINSFLRVFKGQYKLLHQDYQVIIEKV
jgi:predicted O-methyltransferase YrrM